MTLTRIKVVTGHTAFSRFLSEVSDDPIGCIPRQPDIPSPYAYSPTHYVYSWNGRQIITVETRHMRHEVYEVSGKIDPCPVQS